MFRFSTKSLIFVSTNIFFNQKTSNSKFILQINNSDMLKIKLLLIFLLVSLHIFAQSSTDSTKNITNFSGSVGITNNGFSIIPTFSLNSPAFIANLAWRKKKFSFEPDIRLVPNLTKGGMLFWLRYRLVENKKLGLRLGVHPAFNLLRRTDTENGVSKEITELLRFGAFEVVPSYQISKHFGVSAMYLQGHGLQKWGPQFTNVLFLNTAITNISLGNILKFNIFPSVFFLQTDGYRGNYFTATGVLTHKKLPFSIHSAINKTLKSNLIGNKDFIWNVGMTYSFNKNYKRIK